MRTGRLAGGETRGRERGTVRTRSSISRGWMTWKCQRDGGARCSAGTKICVESSSSGHPYSVGHVWWLCKRMGGPRRKMCPSDCQGAHRQRARPATFLAKGGSDIASSRVNCARYAGCDIPRRYGCASVVQGHPQMGSLSPLILWRQARVPDIV
jgi:hypothetical protein